MIKTYQDLCDEKKRLENLLNVQKQRVTDDWNSLKEEFKPVQHVFGVIGKMTSINRSNPLLVSGVQMASDLFIKNILLGKAGWFTRLAVPYIVRNYSTHLLADKGKLLIRRLGSIFRRNKDKDNGSNADYSS